MWCSDAFESWIFLCQFDLVSNIDQGIYNCETHGSSNLVNEKYVPPLWTIISSHTVGPENNGHESKNFGHLKKQFGLK